MTAEAPATFAGTLERIAADLDGVPDTLDLRGDIQEAGSVRRAVDDLRSIVGALDAMDAGAEDGAPDLAVKLRTLARLVRDRDPELANTWDWHRLSTREVGRVNPDGNGVMVTMEQLLLCPRCHATVPRSAADAHAVWHGHDIATGETA